MPGKTSGSTLCILERIKVKTRHLTPKWNRPDVTRLVELEKLAGGEVADKAAVGGQEIVVGELFELDPLELVEDLVLEFAFEGWDGEELQIDGSAVAVVVADMGDMRADGGTNAEFFLKFAGEGLFGGFAVLDFAARELPLEGHGLVGPPLADQNQAFPNQQPCYYETEGGAGRARVGDGLRLFHTSSVNGHSPGGCDG